VILISNASRLSRTVNAQLDKLGFPREAYDSLITSGDVTRDYVAARPNCAVFDVGPGDANAIFEGLDVRFTSWDQADLVVTSGAFDDINDDLAQLQSVLCDMRSRDLLLLCANPDVVTELAGRRVQCSGAVADCYARLGGRVIYAGKPQAPIYDRALDVAAELRGESMRRDRVLVIGDSLSTDIAGANANGFDSLFLWGGIHAGELGSSPSSGALAELFARNALSLTAAAHRLVW
jgi:HAD superfamily hydrolase (TIGR01459 family)